MISRDFFIPSLTTVLVIGMAAFLSCAHQLDQDNEIEESFNSMVSESEQSPTSQKEESPPEKEENIASTHNSKDPNKPTQFSEPAPAIQSPAIIAKINNSYNVPKIPGKAIKRKEGLLNRFYFVRMGDSPESVSNLIYGTPQKSSQLWVAKGQRWATGRLIFYGSQRNPTDLKMMSFYREEEVSGFTLKIKRGNSLSRIANKELGSPKSWIEIAVMNRIKNPSNLEVGQKLMIFPRIQSKPKTPQVVASNNNSVINSNNIPITNSNKNSTDVVNPVPNIEAAPPPVLEVQPRVPLAVEEEKPAKKSNIKEYIRNLIQKFTLLLKRTN